jgi:hypothetical protein
MWWWWIKDCDALGLGEIFLIINSPGSFFVLNDALVIMDFDTVTVVVDGVRATEIPIGPSLGWPKLKMKRKKNPISDTAKFEYAWYKKNVIVARNSHEIWENDKKKIDCAAHLMD